MAIAFLNAFRLYNPDLPLCLIPYRDDEITQLRSLAAVYDFSIFPDTDILGACDQIGDRIRRYDYRFRKLAIWEGDFDHFIYLDVDNIVLEDLSPLFQLLHTYQFVVCDSNSASNIQWVWKDSLELREKIGAEQVEFAANTSFILSKKGALSLAGVKSQVQVINELVPHMQLLCGEQPLLNYLITSSGQRATSLSELHKSGADLGIAYWAGRYKESGMAGQVHPGGRFKVQGVSDRVIFIHWSGLWHARPIDMFVYRLLGLCGIGRGKTRATKLWFPLKRLWLYYRHINESRRHV
jgi:hypothetical protein